VEKPATVRTLASGVPNRPVRSAAAVADTVVVMAKGRSAATGALHVDWLQR
jgi:hypothetical protein